MIELRPPRLPLLWLVPFLAALVAVSVMQIRYWPPHVVEYGLLLLTIGLMSLRYCLLLVRGKTVLGDDGITDQGASGKRTIRWDDIEALRVERTLFGRVVRVAVRKQPGHPARRAPTLAAPRTCLSAGAADFTAHVDRLGGQAERAIPLRDNSSKPSRIILALPICLIVLVVVIVGRPWLDSWWPGRYEATALSSDLCAKLAAADGAQPTVSRSTKDRVRCEWSGKDARIEVVYDLAGRSSSRSAAAEAHKAFAKHVSSVLGANSVPLPLGDEARQTAPNPRNSYVQLAARRANVIVYVTRIPNHPAQPATADLVEFGRQALSRISVH